ncbi:MAG: hypothetical protein AAF170_02920 [Bacteroidota bacterium]
MKQLQSVLLAGLLLVGLSACASSSPASSSARPDTVLATDFMRTLPGQQADYLEFVRLNWMAAREAAMEEGAVVRYEVLTREPVEGEWDVILITEYASPQAYADREAIFQRLFERPELAMKRVNGKGPRDMAAFTTESEVSVTRFAPR